jgi:hypothetical protein
MDGPDWNQVAEQSATVMPEVTVMMVPVMVMPVVNLSGRDSGARGRVVMIAFGFRVSGGYDKSD